jgi:hypothetical protein
VIFAIMSVSLVDGHNVHTILALVNTVHTIYFMTMGRKKLYPERLTVPLATETVERLDAVTEPDEDRLDVIREGIERELKRRERHKS